MVLIGYPETDYIDYPYFKWIDGYLLTYEYVNCRYLIMDIQSASWPMDSKNQKE